VAHFCPEGLKRLLARFLRRKPGILLATGLWGLVEPAKRTPATKDVNEIA